LAFVEEGEEEEEEEADIAKERWCCAGEELLPLCVGDERSTELRSLGSSAEMGICELSVGTSSSSLAILSSRA